MKKLWTLGLEDIDGQQVDVSELESPVEGVEAKLIEVQGLDADIDAMAADGEELARDTDSLEATADVVADAAEDGGMDETAARVVDVAVEHFCERWDIKRTKVATENFGSNRMQATKVALESIGDAVKDAWNTFVTWLTEILNKLKDWWLKYFNAGKAMKTRAEKLEDRLDSVGAQDKKEIGGGWVKDLYIDNILNPAGVIEHGNSAAKDIPVAIRALNTRLEDGKARLVSNTGKGDEVIEFGKKSQKKLDGMIPSGATDLSIQAVPGNGYLIQFTKDGIAESRFQVFPVKDGAEKKVATPDVGVMKKACQSVYKIGDALEERLKDFRSVNDKMSELKDAVKKAAEAKENAKGDERSSKKLALRQARAAVQSALAARTCVTSSLKSAGAGLIGYVQAGISAHKKAA